MIDRKEIMFKPRADGSVLQYPDKGTPNTALICALDCEGYTVISHTGRFFFAQCADAGYSGEEVGVSNLPDDDPGFWVMENGVTWESTDWESGIVDDYGIEGDFRKPTMVDFIRYDFPYPLHVNWFTETLYRVLQLFVKPYGEELTGGMNYE